MRRGTMPRLTTVQMRRIVWDRLLSAWRGLVARVPVEVASRICRAAFVPPVAAFHPQARPAAVGTQEEFFAEGLRIYGDGGLSDRQKIERMLLFLSANREHVRPQTVKAVVDKVRAIRACRSRELPETLRWAAMESVHALLPFPCHAPLCLNPRSSQVRPNLGLCACHLAQRLGGEGPPRYF